VPRAVGQLKGNQSLTHSNRQASRSVAYLAVEIITGLVLASCLIFVRSFRWAFGGAKDNLRTVAFIISVISAIMYVHNLLGASKLVLISHELLYP
jgi:hypothetical protein